MKFLNFGVSAECSARASFRLWRAILILSLLNGAALVAFLAAPKLEASINIRAITPDQGVAYIAPVEIHPRFPYVVLNDAVGAAPSSLELFEDGRPLGPAHAPHDAIRSSGAGRYSHWGTSIWFSASDSSDPRTNGRTYRVSSCATVDRIALAPLWLIDLVAIVLLRRRLWALAKSWGAAIFKITIALAVGAAALAASGAFGRINEAAGSVKDGALVVDVARQAFFGFVLAIAQWAMGAGVATACLGRNRSTLTNVLLLGFPLSLPLLAVLVAIALLAPYGHALAATGWLLCLSPLLKWSPPRRELARLAAVLLAVFPFAVGFGCWMGLLWHGPTATLAGSPSGDVVMYSTSIVSLATHPFPHLNLGYEREIAGYYFNALFPALGAALIDTFNFDPFLFIISSGACFHVVSLALSLYLFANARRQPGQTTLSYLILALSVIVAIRYPYWVVESIPVIHILPVTIAVLYWISEGRTESWARPVAAAIAFVGPALSKVVSMSVLFPLAVAWIVPVYSRVSRAMRGAMLAIAILGILFAVALLVRLGPTMLKLGGLGPASYDLLWHYGTPLSAAYPSVMRDVAAVILAAIAFLFVPWPLASAIAFGYFLFLACPYLFNIDFACSTLLVGLIAFENPQLLKKFAIPTVVGLLLALPVVLLRDPAGLASGLAWVLFIGGACWIALAQAARGWELQDRRFRVWSDELGLASIGMIVVVSLGLIGVARGHIVLDSGWRQGAPELTPQVRDIWLAVRSLTPTDALIFTDQTGREPTLLGGWNTYAITGGRQIFVSDLYQTASLRMDPEKAIHLLNENEAVLSGAIRPDQLQLRDKYGSFFAVVSRSRIVPAPWVKVYENDKYALFRL